MEPRAGGQSAADEHATTRTASDSHLPLMLALTFSTGIADAVGYLGLDKVFSGNMTGNVVILGMAIAGAPGLPVVGPAIALVAFMVGAAIGGRFLRHQSAPWTTTTTALLVTVGVALLASSGVLFFSGNADGEAFRYSITGVFAAAMGLQAATARHIGVKDVTTVVVTSTITGFAADSWFGARKENPWVRRLGAIVLIGAGAGLGALLLPLGIGWGVFASGVISLVVAIVGHRLGRE